MAHPTALFLAPSEYVVYDHRDDTVYVVASASDRENSGGGDGGREGAAGRAKAAGRALMAQILALHAAAATTAAHAPGPAPGPTPLPPLNTTLRALRSRGRYRRDIQTCLEQIAAGETYEVCLTLQVP